MARKINDAVQNFFRVLENNFTTSGQAADLLILSNLAPDSWSIHELTELVTVARIIKEHPRKSAIAPATPIAKFLVVIEHRKIVGFTVEWIRSSYETVDRPTIDQNGVTIQEVDNKFHFFPKTDFISLTWTALTKQDEAGE